MKEETEFGFYMETDAWRVLENKSMPVKVRVATEIPLTIVANDMELATLLTSPSDLKELVYGYLFTSGFIKSADEVQSFVCDTTRWVACVSLEHDPDPELLRTRLYTPGCGKCAMYTNVHEISLRTPCTSEMVVSAQSVISAGQWVSGISTVFRETGGVHIAALFDVDKGVQYYCEDVARHNAVDKAMGKALMNSRTMENMMLVRSGRTSSEILFKAKRANIPVTISRGSPTHHAVCLAKEIGITLIGFARNEEFTIYANEHRIKI
ncbi:MAG: formate dehydrogenase accessory sulfurtransferase FdhD [Candidatus Brocadiae bacterium]|nr:formate dehydrogenase accessory sulfurtransferase FdhD [Candidatus Brocadiia bacterium]